MKESSLKTGRIGEAMAREYLKKKGYEIVEQNYRTRYAEIDLVCQQKESLVLVEVRTKIGEDYGTPEDTINNKKKRKLHSNALAYARTVKWKGPCRVDAVCIVLRLDYSVERLNHYENIVEN